MKRLLPILLGCLITLAGCVPQQNIDILDNRVDRLERENAKLAQSNAELKSMLEDGTTQQDRQTRDKLAGMSAEISRLNEEIRVTRGMLEETEYRLKTGQGGGVSGPGQARVEKLEAAIDRLTIRLERIESHLDMELTKQGAPPPSGTGAGGQPPPKASADMELYNSAKKSLERGDVEAAREGFQKLVTRYPNSEIADNAQFWLGEIFYREKWYEKAILEYQKVIENYPKGNKVQAALYKQGLSFNNIGDKSNARLILQELIKKYPQSTEAKSAIKKLKDL